MSTSTAINPMGLKRICTSCGGRFYDLNKRPIMCPECDTEFTGEVKAKTRRGRAPAEVKKEEPVIEIEAKKEEGEILDEDPEVEVVSLDDAETVVKEENDDDDTILGEDTLDDIPELSSATDDDSDSLEEDILLDDEEEV